MEKIISRQLICITNNFFFIMKRFFFTAVLLMIATGFISAQNGSIRGIVYDENKQPMPGANVYVKVGDNKIGVITDERGIFTIKPLNSGSYDLNVSFIGYTTKVISNMYVHPDKISFQDIYLAVSVGILIGDGIDVVAYRDKIIDPEKRVTIRTAELKRMPDTRDVSGILRGITTDFKVSNDGKEIYFRGSRSDASAFYVDGVRVETLSGSLPSSAIGSFSVFSGGVPAKYGDFTGGVVVIESKSYFETVNEWNARMRNIK